MLAQFGNLRTEQGRAKALILAKLYDGILMGNPAILRDSEFSYSTHAGHTIKERNAEFYRAVPRDEFLAELAHAMSAEFAGTDWAELYKRNFRNADFGNFKFTAYAAV